MSRRKYSLDSDDGGVLPPRSRHDHTGARFAKACPRRGPPRPPRGTARPPPHDEPPRLAVRARGGHGRLEHPLDLFHFDGRGRTRAGCASGHDAVEIPSMPGATRRPLGGRSKASVFPDAIQRCLFGAAPASPLRGLTAFGTLTVFRAFIAFRDLHRLPGLHRLAFTSVRLPRRSVRGVHFRDPRAFEYTGGIDEGTRSRVECLLPRRSFLDLPPLSLTTRAASASRVRRRAPPRQTIEVDARRPPGERSVFPATSMSDRSGPLGSQTSGATSISTVFTIIRTTAFAVSGRTVSRHCHRETLYSGIPVASSIRRLGRGGAWRRPMRPRT